MSYSQKIPYAVSSTNYIQSKIDASQEYYGQILPCKVVSVNGAFVTINFQVDTNGQFTFPPVTCPIAESEYVRIPVKVGDTGICIPAATRLGGITGTGTGLAPLGLQPNLGGLVFMPIASLPTSSNKWFKVDTNSVNIYATENTLLIVSGANVTVTTSLATKGNVSAGTGATGSFTTPTGQIVTVQNGIITNIY